MILSALVCSRPLRPCCPSWSLLGLPRFLKLRVHYAALLGLAVAVAVALFRLRMPLSAVAATTVYGAGLRPFPIGWIILNLMFLYQLTVRKGLFAVLRGSFGNAGARCPDSGDPDRVLLWRIF